MHFYKNNNINTNGKICIELHTDNNYVLPTIVTLTSLIANKDKSSIYEIRVLGNNLTKKNIKLLKKAVGEYGKVIPHISSFSKFEGTHPHVSSTDLFKFDLPDVLSDWDKVLYIDTDMIIQSDLSELFNIDLGDNYIAAVKDMAGVYDGHAKKLGHKSYFNAGMMLMNLKKMREENIGAKLIDYKLHKDCGHFMSQDALNYVFNEKVLYISPIYNWMAPNQLKFSNQEIKDFYGIDFDLSLDNTVIVHLTNRKKVWNYKNTWGFDLWYEYYKKSVLKPKKLFLMDESEKEKCFLGWFGNNEHKVFYLFWLPFIRVRTKVNKITIDIFNIRVYSKNQKV